MTPSDVEILNTKTQSLSLLLTMEEGQKEFEIVPSPKEVLYIAEIQVEELKIFPTLNGEGGMRPKKIKIAGLPLKENSEAEELKPALRPT